MKRSEINKVIKEFEALLKEYKFALPPYLSFTPEEWQEKGHEYDEIRDNALGWDVTDYGEGNFDKKGLALITIRNGNANNPKYTKTYAEKIMMLREGQLSPNHFHWKKMEDIINRGGGNVVFHLWNATKDEELGDPPAARSCWSPVRASPSTPTTTTTFLYRPARAAPSSARCPCATTTTRTTASMSLWAASPPSRRMSPPIVCCATSIPPQKTKPNAKEPARNGLALFSWGLVW